MGRYKTRALTSQEYRSILRTLEKGFTDSAGVKHRPNKQLSTIITLESNLGCRIGDILALKADSIVRDGDIYRLDIIEQKTGKYRRFIVPEKVVDYINSYKAYTGIESGKLFNISAGAVWKQIRAVTDVLNLKNVSTHSFRKMCACNLYEATGHDIETVCAFLQHSSIKTTRTYISRSPEQLEKAIQAIVDLG